MLPLICVFFVILAPSCTAYIFRRSYDHPSDRAILTNFYRVCNGPSWNNQGSWLNESISMCNWQGIQGCSIGLRSGRISNSVNSFFFMNNNVSCSTTSLLTLCDLPRLYIIFMSDNFISGSLSRNFSRCSVLRTLILSRNSLIGEIPDVFGAMSGLETLDLSSNRLEGSIPSTLFQLPYLETLILSNNRLTGNISDSPRALSSLSTIILSGNQLSGPPVLSFGQMFAFYYADFSNNRFTGTIPNNTEDLAAMSHIDMSRNRLEGTIPDSFNFLPNLNFLDLSRNALIGRLPRFNSTALSFIDFSYNRLDGDFNFLSESFGPVYVDVSFNQLTGPFPLYQFTPGTKNHSFYINVRGNEFACPFPMYDSSILLLRSMCIPPWSLYWQYIAIVVGAMLFIGISVLVIRRFCLNGDTVVQAGPSRIVRLSFWISCFVSALFLAADFLGIWNIVLYVRQPIDNCGKMNDYEVFSQRMPPLVYFANNVVMDPRFTALIDINREFWINQTQFRTFKECLPFLDQLSLRNALMDGAANYTEYVDSIMSAFASHCAEISGCGYSPAAGACVIADTNALEFGGASFERCDWYAIAVMALIGLVEFLRLLAVLWTARMGTVRWNTSVTDFAVGSIFSPLLRIFLGEVSFNNDVIGYQSTSPDLLWRIVHQSLLRSLPLVALNYYFLTSIAQTGLVWTNAISLLNGFLSIPILLIRAVTRYRQASVRTVATDGHDRSQHAEEFVIDEFRAPNSKSRDHAVPLPPVLELQVMDMTSSDPIFLSAAPNSSS